MFKGMIKLIESPRDAMQGIHEFIPTKKKVDFINSLLKVGFNIIDLGSFVSPKAIPQLSDTAEVIQQIDMNGSTSDLLVIVANKKGGEIASKFDQIKILGFPYSISEKFLQLNINSDRKQSLERIDALLDICEKEQKVLLVYISMAFGNPYGEVWNHGLLEECAGLLQQKGVKRINLSDTIGVATPKSIKDSFASLIPLYPDMEFGFHLHTTEKNWYANIDAAYSCGCRSFDGVINGLGGCPMSGYELVGNLSTINLIRYFDEKKIPLKINREALEEARSMALRTFPLN